MAADVDVMDIEADDDGVLSVLVPPTEQHKARVALSDSFTGIDFEMDEVQFLPKGETPIAAEDVDNYNKFIDMLNFLDDVQQVFTDAKLPE